MTRVNIKTSALLSLQSERCWCTAPKQSFLKVFLINITYRTRLFNLHRPKQNIPLTVSLWSNPITGQPTLAPELQPRQDEQIIIISTQHSNFLEIRDVVETVYEKKVGGRTVRWRSAGGRRDWGTKEWCNRWTEREWRHDRYKKQVLSWLALVSMCTEAGEQTYVRC